MRVDNGLSQHAPKGAFRVFIMEIQRNQRRFAFSEFKDRNGVECNIQKSSLATEDAIWFGAKEIGLQQFIPNGNPSWRPFELDRSDGKTYVANNRMHLTRSQVEKLLPILQRFVDTGGLYE